MPRPIEFDRDAVLRKGMNVFWRRGYHATSMRELVAATGLQPGSLYGAFGNKRGLFLAALQTYFEESLRRIDAILAQEKPPLQRIEEVFSLIVNRCETDSDNRGCLMVNTLLEMPVEDPEIGGIVSGMFRALEQRFESALNAAQCAGDLPPDRDCREEIARGLIVVIHGLRVYSKTRPASGHLARFVDDYLGRAFGARSDP